MRVLCGHKDDGAYFNLSIEEMVNMNAVLSHDILRHRNEVLRALRNNKYEVTPDGIYLPSMHAHAAGVFEHWKNGADHRVDPNIFVLSGLDTLFTTGLTGGTFYLAPFSNNLAPVNTLTAATFPGTQGEFTNYTEGSRQQWVKDAYTNTQTLTNGGTKAVITANTGGGTVWGFGLTSASGKSATSGTLIACAQFASSRVLAATDTLTVQYTLTLTTS